jgi:valyl-tRNA synthetase
MAPMSDDQKWRAIDLDSLPKHFDSVAAEVRWNARWDQLGVHRYDPTRPRDETFVVDTPPPTVSGSLHVGHVFSYTHADVLVRYQRMCGRNIFYPMGWDDNGLPTERRVQNYFHVRCDPHQPYEADLKLEQAKSDERRRRPRLVSRPNFIELCHVLTATDEQSFMQLWRRLALSVDWSQEYATINDHCRRLAQLSFIDLYEKGHVYNADAPTMWDVDFQTAVALAEVEDRELPGAFHSIRFGVEGSSEGFVIATTRPELLPACVGVAAHPDDERYQGLFGKRAITPLFRTPVPIFATELADPKKGTGILMVCTFGDQTDVLWWREHELAFRVIISRAGRLMPVNFGTADWPSLDPEAANRYYAGLEGTSIAAAKHHIVELLRAPEAAATPELAASHGAPLVGEPRPITHAVKFFEKGDRPLELIRTRQWFVRLLDKKQQLLDAGDQIRWHPSFMGRRYADWTQNLGLDWCISRQRYFGVSFPIWYRLDDAGQPDYAQPIFAEPERLPVDPMTDIPPGFTAEQRGQPGGFVGEPDVYDTWFTSSLTPQIGSHWRTDERRHERLFPANIRPQSHEIIRTWAFYTIVKALLHEQTIPWHDVVISGWVLDPDRKKMSKSKGNVLTPLHLFDQYTADGVRYWSASARLGTDTAFDENQLKVGKRLVTKIFNAGKYVLSQTAEPGPITAELDRAFVAKLARLVEQATRSFEAFEFASAVSMTEAFFWGSFTDAYLELAKTRARSGDEASADRSSAVATLRLGLNVLLRLFAPVLPYITEEVWSWAFAAETGRASIHVAPWPSAGEFEGVDAPVDLASFTAAVEALTAINRAKTSAGVSTGRPAIAITLACNEDTSVRVTRVLEDVRAAARATELELVIDASLDQNAFEVRASAFEAKPDR